MTWGKRSGRCYQWDVCHCIHFQSGRKQLWHHSYSLWDEGCIFNFGTEGLCAELYGEEGNDEGMIWKLDNGHKGGRQHVTFAANETRAQLYMVVIFVEALMVILCLSTRSYACQHAWASLPPLILAGPNWPSTRLKPGVKKGEACQKKEWESWVGRTSGIIQCFHITARWCKVELGRKRAWKTVCQMWRRAIVGETTSCTQAHF